MIQTCAVACYSIAVGGGFGSHLLGLNKKTFEQSGGFSAVGNSPSSIKEPGLGWMTGFLFLVCFIGLFVLIPLRKAIVGRFLLWLEDSWKMQAAVEDSWKMHLISLTNMV